MKHLEDWAAVHRVYKQTGSKRRTADLLGISRNTVKKLLALSEEPVYKRTCYPSKLDSYKEQIIIWRCDPYFFNGTRILAELKKRGYTGSIGPVYRFLRKVDEDCDGQTSTKATTRHESPPGDQAQFDWSEYQVSVGGVIQTVYCFSMILAASRKKAICFSLREDADAIYEAIQELFEDLGGVTLELLIDNPKALVIQNKPRSEEEIKYNPHALLMAAHLRTELNACPCYWPRKKGKIERPFNYIEEQFIKGNQFDSMEELNRRGKEFINEWCNDKHSTTQRIPNEHYLLEEKQMLQPLPKGRYRMSPLKPRIVSPDSFVSINTNKYSVPVRYMGKRVFYQLIYGFRIEIYDSKGNLILKTETVPGKKKVIKDDEHYKEIAPRTPTSIPQIRRDFTALFKNGERYLTEAGRKFDQPTHHARKILEFRDIYDDEVLDSLIGVAINQNALDIWSFRELLKTYNKNNASTGNASKPAKSVPSDESLVRDCSYYQEALTGGKT